MNPKLATLSVITHLTGILALSLGVDFSKWLTFPLRYADRRYQN